MKKLNSYFLFLIFSIVFDSAFAEVPARPLPTDTRLVVFTYDANNSFEIFTRPNAVTDIQMSEGEKVIALALGDTIQWEWHKTNDGQHIFIKPKFENLYTSATLVTSKRTYQIILKSSTVNGKWYQRVTWNLENSLMLDETIEQKIKTAEATSDESKLSPGTGLDELNFNYTVEGDAPFKPVNVFDNGKFTYLRMSSKIQELPALFMVTPDDDVELINYTVKGDYLIIQRLLDKILLKIGKKEVKILKQDKNKKSFFNFLN